MWYEDTVTKKIENLKFDLVVLSAALIPRKDVGDLVKVLGIEVDPYGFVKSSSSISDPVDTTVPGIFACGYCLGPKTGDIPDSVSQGSAAASRAAEVIVGGK